MNKLLWLIGGTTLAVAVFALLSEVDALPSYGGERAAGEVGGWGLKQRAAGTGGKVLGKVEEITGHLTGNESTRTQGVFDQAKGAVRDAAGQAAEALGSTIHDLNKA